MEDALEVYAEPYDPRRPKVNCDETSKQLIKETHIPLPAQAGQPQRFDDEYERHGTRHAVAGGRMLPRSRGDARGAGQSQHA
jgi:hypothetical protein